MTDWLAKVPPRVPVSIAPAPYRPPVWASLFMILVAAIGAWAFVAALLWALL